MKVRFDHQEPIANQISSFYFRPKQAVRYLAGQFIELSLPHHNSDERGEKHWFTLSSSPIESLLAVSTRLSDPGSSFKQVLRGLKPGDSVDMSEPMGDFVLPQDASIPLLFVAGGIGITPVRSMVKWLSDSRNHRSITLLYAARNPSDFAFKELFAAHAMDTRYLVSKESSEAWHGDVGQVSADMVINLCQGMKSRVYLSGPERMVESLVSDLGSKGIKNEQLVTDYFPGYQSI